MSFSLDLSKFTKHTEKNMEAIVKKVFIELSADIIKDTPVLSGRLKANWLPAINRYSDMAISIFDKRGRGAIGKVVKESQKFELGDTLTLTNNVVYARSIEFGASKHKSPKGMVRRNVNRFQSMVKKYAKDIKRKSR